MDTIAHPAEIVPAEKVAELEAKIDTASLEASMTYTLADAIREGASVTGQCIKRWSTSQDACALSAAMIAVKARHA